MQTVSFSTAARPSMAETLPLARETLKRTRSFSATARQTGIPEITLREWLAPPAPRPVMTPAALPVVAATPLSIREIIMLCCAEEELSYAEIISDDRRRHIAWPRQRMMWIIRRAKPNASLPEIGRRFGGRDHTTVLHALSRVEQLYQSHDEERAKLDALVKAMEAVASRRVVSASLDAEIEMAKARLNGLLAQRARIEAAA